jgi:acyl-coenzyme A synthetase/AMP-(fatty) acid ligase
VINDAPSVPALVNELVRQVQPTLLFGVPAFYAGFLRLPEASLPPTTRFVMSAGESLSSGLFERFQERFGQPLIDGLGATEALHFITSNRLDDVGPGSAGRPIDGFEVCVLDRDLQELPENQAGQLWVKGPSTFAGYWRQPQLTDGAYRGEWMRTGDLVRLLDGRVYHEGRVDDLLKVGGMWVAPVQIEDVIRTHEDVMDAAVVAADDGSGVPTVRAFVVSERNDDRLRKELLRLCRDRLAGYKVPSEFAIVDELPRTVTGKLRRFVLRSGAATGGTP